MISEITIKIALANGGVQVLGGGTGATVEASTDILPPENGTESFGLDVPSPPDDISTELVSSTVPPIPDEVDAQVDLAMDDDIQPPGGDEIQAMESIPPPSDVEVESVENAVEDEPPPAPTRRRSSRS